MLQTIKERLKNKVVLTAILSQVFIIIALISPQIADEIKVFAVPVLEILTLLGVVNNPTDPDNL